MADRGFESVRPAESRIVTSRAADPVGAGKNRIKKQCFPEKNPIGRRLIVRWERICCGIHRICGRFTGFIRRLRSFRLCILFLFGCTMCESKKTENKNWNKQNARQDIPRKDICSRNVLNFRCLYHTRNVGTPSTWFII